MREMREMGKLGKLRKMGKLGKLGKLGKMRDKISIAHCLLPIAYSLLPIPPTLWRSASYTIKAAAIATFKDSTS